MGKWKYETAIPVKTAYGRPVDKCGHFLGNVSANQIIANAAVALLEDLFALLDRYDASIEEDSEQGEVIIGFGTGGFEVAYNNASLDKATLMHNGALVGRLARESTS